MPHGGRPSRPGPTRPRAGARLALSGFLVAAALAGLGGCDYGRGTCGCQPSEACVGGRCLAVSPLPNGDYVDPRATPVDCGPYTLVDGGLNPGAPASDPGCALAPRDSALPPVAPGTPHGWIDLGVHAVDGPPVTFTVPPGTLSLTVIEQAVSALPTITLPQPQPPDLVLDNVAVPLTLVDPSGATVYDDRQPAPADGSGLPLFFASGAAGTGTLAFPDTSAGLAALAAAWGAGGDGVAPGIWSLQPGDWALECWLDAHQDPPPAQPLCDAASASSAGTYRVFVLTAPAAAPGAASAVPPKGTLDVAFHLLGALDAGGAAPLLAADAVADPHVGRLVASYAALLANAGLCLGTATFYDEPAWAVIRFATGTADTGPGPCATLPQALSLSVAGARTLELFLVPRIGLPDPATGQTVVGIDGTVPGPATVNGTVASGAVVSAADLFFEKAPGACPAGGAPLALAGCGADLVAYIAAHESGHFLGLYHPTEADGAAFDPLADTPHCECAPACGHVAGSCAAGMLASDCLQGRPQCSGGGNLMFWIVQPSVSQGFLSPEQGEVARLGPLPRFP